MPKPQDDNEVTQLEEPVSRNKAAAPDIRRLGQVFTPPQIVHAMLRLRKNRGTVLEPSAGDGAFMAALDGDAVGIELDARVNRDSRVHRADFFAYSLDNQFDTIIGNPPYVRFQDIRASTKRLLPMEWFDKRSNLYLFFIAKCIAHLRSGGELIFITPRDFLKSTNAKRLNRELYQQGSITDFYELGDARIFQGVAPNCAVWRWQRDCRSRKTNMGNLFCQHNGQLWFGKPARHGVLGDFFNVKVGAVSGADEIFANQRYANVDMVCSRTRQHGDKRKMIYNKKCAHLKKFKRALLQRKIKPFDETNWWQWGRAYHHQPGARIYVNCKTRQDKPFFVSDAQAYDGSVLALFPQPDAGIDLGKAADKLNKVDWQSLGFVCDGRLMFTQRSLQNAAVGDCLSTN